MFKLTLIIITFFSVGGYLYYSGKDVDTDHEDEDLEASFEEEVQGASKSILAEEKLHQAFEKILEKKAEDERAPSSDDSQEETPPDEVIDSYTYANVSESDFESEFEELSATEREKMIQNLKFEIGQDEKLLEQMENDQRSGLNITEADIAAITQRTENKKIKLEIFISKMNSRGE
jgi:hypothetical protein